MADPLAITTGVLSLIGVCFNVGLQLREFKENVSVVNTTVIGLIGDVEGLGAVSESMRETFQQSENEALLNATGHIGSHWRNIARALLDSQTALVQLEEILESVNKSARVLDTTRRQLRYQAAADQIAHYRQKIQSYRDALQLSLQTLILWNQVTFQASADKILPNLSDLHQEVRRIAAILNSQIKVLQVKVVDNENNSELEAAINLQHCVRSSATMMSSASTVISRGPESIYYGSEFGDDFSAEQSEDINRWIESNPLYEAQEPPGTDLLSLKSRETEFRVRNAPSEGSTDSDSELESELTVALMDNGKRKLESQDWPSAERLFRNCLLRIPERSRNSNSSTSTSTKLRVSRQEVLQLLVDTHMEQENWSGAQSALLEKLSLTSTSTSETKSNVRSTDLLRLVSIVLKKGDYIEANLYARRALKESRKQGDAGVEDVRRSLTFLVEICHHEEKLDEQEAYEALLANLPTSGALSVLPEPSHADVSHDKILNSAENLNIEDEQKPNSILNEASTPDIVQQAVNKVTLIQARLQPTAEIVQGKKLDSDGNIVDDQQRTLAKLVRGNLSACVGKLSDKKGQILDDEGILIGRVEVVKRKVTYDAMIALHPELVTELEEARKAAEAAKKFSGNPTDDLGPKNALTASGLMNSAVDEAAAPPAPQNTMSSIPAITLRPPIPVASQEWSAGDDIQLLKPADASVVEELHSKHTLAQTEPTAAQALTTPLPLSNSDLKKHPTDESTALKKKIMVVGDIFVGKTCLVFAQAHGTFLESYRSSAFEEFESKVTIDGSEVQLSLFDAGGDDVYDRLRALLYPGTHVVVIVFSIANPDSLDNVWERWAPEVVHFMPTIPRLLVGTCSDLRSDGKTGAELLKTNQHPVTTAEGEEMARRIGATKYFECAAKLGTGVTEIFEYAARLALLPPHKRRKSLFRRIFS